MKTQIISNAVRVLQYTCMHAILSYIYMYIPCIEHCAAILYMYGVYTYSAIYIILVYKLYMNDYNNTFR